MRVYDEKGLREAVEGLRHPAPKRDHNLPSGRYRRVWLAVVATTAATAVLAHVASFLVEFEEIRPLLVGLALGTFVGNCATYPGLPPIDGRAGATPRWPRWARIALMLLGPYVFIGSFAWRFGPDAGSPTLGLRCSSAILGFFAFLGCLVFRYNVRTRDEPGR